MFGETTRNLLEKNVNPCLSTIFDMIRVECSPLLRMRRNRFCIGQKSP